MSVAVDVRVEIPEAWREFWSGMDPVAVVGLWPAPQPDPVQWLNDRMRYWTPTP